jgi:hypothetical protein
VGLYEKWCDATKEKNSANDIGPTSKRMEGARSPELDSGCLDAAHHKIEDQYQDEQADGPAWCVALPKGSEPPEVAAKGDEQQGDDTG